jgi:hypothetical protein
MTPAYPCSSQAFINQEPETSIYPGDSCQQYNQINHSNHGESMRKIKFRFFSLLIEGLLLISAAACTHKTLSLPGQPTPLPPAPTVPGSPTPLPLASSGLREGSYPEIRRVTVQDAKAALDSRSAVFIDVRGSSAYAVSHIPGALDIPLAEIESRLNELDPDQWIITYCT